ncbi:MAG: type III-B CRISPR module RAMP protein Cmr1 [Venatoribacter sp.]
MIRKPEISAPSSAELAALKWHSIECELVTPMYGGGVESTVVDEKMPIRVSSIRGQLRFWWRLLAEHKWKLGSAKAIREAEFDLWGGMGDANGSKSSKVFIRVEQPQHTALVDYDDKEINLPYVLFPAANETDESKNPHRLLKAEDSVFVMQIAFSNLALHQPVLIEQVIEALRWWGSFGGLGFRSRRGLGAVRLIACSEFEQVTQSVSAEEAALANCRLIMRGNAGPNAMQQLRNAIQRLADFRQGKNIGRNPGQQHNRPGRSRWPEPDALRRIQRTHHTDHAPVHAAGNVFPRALFGAPIIYHFVGRGEPRDVELKFATGERLPSPIIIRPYLAENTAEPRWFSAVLVLPYQHLLNQQVTVGSRELYPVWQADVVQHIQPVRDNNGTDPIQAFANFFAG